MSRRNRMLGITAALAVTVALVAPAGAPASTTACPYTNVIATNATLPKVRAGLLCLVNRLRATHHLKPLHLQSTLHQAALFHTRDMVNNHFFAHPSSNGDSIVKRIKRFGYMRKTKAWGVRENIAWGTGTFATPAHVMVDWRDYIHMHNMLYGAARDVGFGLVAKSPYGDAGQALTLTMDLGFHVHQ